MARKKNEPVRTTLEEVNEQLSTAAQRLEDNKKYIYWALGAIAVIVLLVAGYVYGIHNPNMEKAKDLIGKADLEMLQGDRENALKDYEKVFDAYSNKPAERAALNAAILLYQDGKYKEAVAYLEKYDPEGNLVGPAALSLMGDCYVNLKDYEKALVAFDKAIHMAGDNAYYAPTFLMKKATLMHAKKNYKEELRAYETIRDKFPEYQQIYQLNLDKYIERAKALAEGN
ncbi:MAG: tetratricopeptide repeat protein [Muribaculaceae bacterium]|nr:tetratricopeptide repeat protein [Muribaculaceae bacterium]